MSPKSSLAQPAQSVSRALTADTAPSTLYIERVATYLAREWDTAERQFRRCLELRPGDALSTLHIERVATFRKDPPPTNWDGVWHLTKK